MKTLQHSFFGLAGKWSHQVWLQFFKKKRCSDGATKKLKFYLVTATSTCYDQSHGQVRQERLLDEVQNLGVQHVDWQPCRPPLLSWFDSVIQQCPKTSMFESWGVLDWSLSNQTALWPLKVCFVSYEMSIRYQLPGVWLSWGSKGTPVKCSALSLG